MIDVRPYDDTAAWAVISRLDASDFLEAELTRGASAVPVALFADWRAAQGARVGSWVAYAWGMPFAVVAVMHTGQAGVAAGALLARDHVRWRRPLAELALIARQSIGPWAEELGIHRIEARCWADHPTASGLLSGLGFAHEADLPGFGADGTITFRQFAWLRS